MTERIIYPPELPPKAEGGAEIIVCQRPERCLCAQLVETAAFLDRMAGVWDAWWRHTRLDEHGELAADCRAMAKKLRGET